MAINQRISVTDEDRLQHLQLPPVLAPREDGRVVNQQLSGEWGVVGLVVSFGASLLHVHSQPPAYSRRRVADVGTRAARTVAGSTA